MITKKKHLCGVGETHSGGKVIQSSTTQKWGVYQKLFWLHSTIRGLGQVMGRIEAIVRGGSEGASSRWEKGRRQNEQEGKKEMRTRPTWYI